MPKKLCIQDKGVRFGIFLVTLIKVDNHIWQSWLQLVYFRRPELFPWNVHMDYIARRKTCQPGFPPSWPWLRPVSGEKRLFSRWGLLTQMPMLLSILRVIVPKACAILKPLEVSSGHNLPSYWHTTHLPSKSRAFWQHFNECLFKFYTHPLRHGRSLPSTAACSNLGQSCFCGASEGIIGRGLKAHNQGT